MKISTILFLLFFNLLVIGSCRMAESGYMAGLWWSSFAGLALVVFLVFAFRNRTGIW
ncbi:MAG TPA: hypothetical protein VEB63_07680 [Chitinophagaceae bacterium]|nr:hypothetical protein [Chitinophagaceae bacterium]